MKKTVKVLNQKHGDRFSIYHGDNVQAIQGLPDNSIGLTNGSPPFRSLYTYSDYRADMGNSQSVEEFNRHLGYLVPELYRVTIPGRLMVMHCKDMPLYMGTHEAAGLSDFPGDLIRIFEGELDTLKNQLTGLLMAVDVLEANHADTTLLDQAIEHLNSRIEQATKRGWVFHSRVAIWKDPKTEMLRTNNSGLVYTKGLCADSSMSRQGMADYLIVMRKYHPDMDGLKSSQPVTNGTKTRFDRYIGYNSPKVSKSDARSFSIHTWRHYASPVWSDIEVPIWQRYAEPAWFDIDQTDVLNHRIARDAKDEKHICPEQLGVLRRSIELWSNPGDVVLDAWNGVGSTGVAAAELKRRYIGLELKDKYFDVAGKFLSEMEAVEQQELDFSAA